VFLKIDHIGIAVRSIASSARVYSGRIGMPFGAIETLPAEGIRVGFLGRGETRLELLEPIEENGTVARFLSKRGEGFHHLCLAVEDIEAALSALEGAGVRTVGEAPRSGAGGSRIAFLNPKDTGGVLIELSESPAQGEKIEPGQTVLVYLCEPKERFWEVLRDIAPHGITVEGIDLSSFDSWTSSAVKGDRDAHATTALFPSHRIERILLDRPSGEAESLEERFRSRVGTSLASFLDRNR